MSEASGSGWPDTLRLAVLLLASSAAAGGLILALARMAIAALISHS